MARGRFTLILFAVLLVLRLGQQAVTQSYEGPGPLRVSRAVVIPDAQVDDVAGVLRRNGVIGNALVFRVAAYFTRRDGPIHAGAFVFHARGSLHDVLNVLRFAAPASTG